MSLLNCSKHAKIMAMKRIYVPVFISCSSYCRYVEKEQLSLNSPEPNNYPGSSMLSPSTSRPWSVIQHGSSYPPKQRYANHDVSEVKLLNELVLPPFSLIRDFSNRNLTRWNVSKISVSHTHHTIYGRVNTSTRDGKMADSTDSFEFTSRYKTCNMYLSSCKAHFLQ